ncbi:MAG TPA: hypothetical protein DCW90_23210 [Lachnospiraceae bacterium]|nr:metallopeptidase TldD-related protein [uncultured Lachnoclostridium sp.]HAU88276.1 hypothetical protein [Lachnospiraceae bacterium]
MEWEYFVQEENKSIIRLSKQTFYTYDTKIREDLRGLKDGKIAMTSNFGKHRGREALEKNFLFWNKSDVIFPSGQEPIELDIYDENIGNMSMDKQKDVALDFYHQLERGCECQDVAVEVAKSIVTKKYRNSKGVTFTYNKSIIRANAQVSFWVNGEKETIVEKKVFTHLDVNQLLKNCVKEKQMYLESCGSAKVRMKEPYGCVLQGQALVGIFMPLRKFLRSKKGMVFNPLVSILDSSLETGMENSFPYDDEGIKGQKTELVKDGQVIQTIFDLQKAGKIGVQSTGNGIRSMEKKALLPRYSNMIMKEGDESLSEVINGIGNGLLINRIAGNGINNYSDGRFVLIVEEGFVISNGKIAGSAKNTVLEGNVIDVLGGISMKLGNKRSYVGSGIYAPFLYTEAIKCKY